MIESFHVISDSACWSKLHVRLGSSMKVETHVRAFPTDLPFCRHSMRVLVLQRIEEVATMVGAGGLVASIIAFAVGAILDYAVTVSPNQHGFNVNKVGVILMIVGVIGSRVLSGHRHGREQHAASPDDR